MNTRLTEKLLRDAEALVRTHPRFDGELELKFGKYKNSEFEFDAVVVCWTDGEVYCQGPVDIGLVEIQPDVVLGLANEALHWITMARMERESPR